MIISSAYQEIPIPERPLTDHILQGVTKNPDKPALIDGASGRTLTYVQLYGAINLTAAGLAQRGFQKGDVFAIYCPNIPEYAVIFHAVSMLGGIVTTINPLYTVDELSHQLEDANAKYLLTVPPFIDKAAEAAKRSGIQELFVFGEAEGAIPFASLMQHSEEPPKVSINPAEDLVVLPYSSGTTGLPKGVMLTHRNLVANLSQLQAADMGTFEITGDDTMIAVLPFFHIYGMTILMNYALLVGATVVTMPRFDLEGFLALMEKHGVTYASLVPPIVLALAKHPVVDRYDLSKLRCIVSGAAPLGLEVEEACAARLDCAITQAYGLTETSPAITVNARHPDAMKPQSIGGLIPNTEAKIVDVGTQALLRSGQEGEICIRGPQVMKGYHNNPQATANTLDDDGWLHTGDIGYADEDGYLYIVDRLKELIKYKGLQVAPAELEAVLLGHPNVADAAVIGSPDEEAGEVPKAFVVLQGDATAQDLMDFVASRVAPYKKIRAVEFVEQIPKSVAGKILRRVLAEQEREQVAKSALVA